jgi:hypothetical protein
VGRAGDRRQVEDGQAAGQHGPSPAGEPQHEGQAGRPDEHGRGQVGRAHERHHRHRVAGEQEREQGGPDQNDRSPDPAADRAEGRRGQQEKGGRQGFGAPGGVRRDRGRQSDSGGDRRGASEAVCSLAPRGLVDRR